MKQPLQYIAIGFIAVALIAPSFSSAQTVSDLQAQIAALLAQVQKLQGQLPQTPNSAVAFCHEFSKDLRMGDKGDEVGALQTVLQKEGFAIAGAGGANPVFGKNTAAAVKSFQEKYSADTLSPAGLKSGNGFVRKLTRGKLNALYKCVAAVAPVPLPVPSPAPAQIVNPPPPATPSSTNAPATSTPESATSTAILPPAVSCSLSLANASIKVGEAAAWIVSSTPSSLAAYWHGTKDGVVDMNEVFAGGTNFSLSYVYQTGEAGTYTRYLRVADASGNKNACITSTITFTVSPS